MRTAAIYALFDPRDGSLRYVGKALNVAERLREHLKEASKSGGSHRRHWLRSLIAQDLKPQAVVLESVTTDTWSERERWHIAHLRRLGFRLVNATDGGEGSAGYKPTAETLRRMSEAAKAIRISPELAKKKARILAEINRGKPCSALRRAALCAGQRRRFTGPQGDEHRRLMSERSKKLWREQRAEMAQIRKESVKRFSRDASGKFVSKHGG